MHLYLLKLLEISEIVRMEKITNGLKKSLLKIIKTTCSHDMKYHDIIFESLPVDRITTI